MNDANLLEDQPIAWTPTPEVIDRARLTQFMKQVGISTWDELYAYSINDVENFTKEVLRFLDIKFDPPYEKLLDTSNGIEFPKWFAAPGVETDQTRDGRVDGKNLPQSRQAAKQESETNATGFRTAGLNITEMCLDRWQTDEVKDQPAVIWEGEDGSLQTIPYNDLLNYVEWFAGGLRGYGFGKGDAIGVHLPMIPETIITLLAIGRIGAIAVPVFSGYGIDAISSRLNAVGAKALFACSSFQRRNKNVNSLSTALSAIEKCPSIKKLFVMGHDVIDWASMGSYSVEQICHWTSLINVGSSNVRTDLSFGKAEPTSAEDPLIILYTSGTTGKPKGIAHTHASFPIKAAQDMAFGTDVGRGTRISWYTDIGWMMGPWLIYGALINGATICIYDGAPDYPTPDRMWEFCAKHKVEVLGISPTLIRSLANRSGDTPVPIGGSSAENSSGRGGDVKENKTVAIPERKGWYRSLKLPHYDGEVTQFITFRLADSLPKGVLDRMRVGLEHDGLRDDSEAYRQLVEDYLDQGAGECILRRSEIARLVSETILYEHENSCDIKAWVVMPNHVHILLRMRSGSDLGSLMKRVKGISARKINEAMGGSGPVWQADYFDRYVRDAEHFSRVFSYIENNPVAARLCSAPNEWEFGSAGWSGGSPVSMGSSSTANSSEHRSDVRGDKSVPAPFERHDLSSLRIFASTGEPWNPDPWWWLFEKVGNSKLPIINYSGGTEISGGILMGNPLLPIKPCSFPAPCPGMDVDILDEDGKPVGPNEVGELVIKQPWIGMARGFWQEKERYLETYWRRFKNIWVHGDWAMRDSDGHWFILGRSDDTLKVAGKRVGPAEVESILVSHASVVEAAVIGVPDEVKGTAMVAFCVIRNDGVQAPSEDELKSLVARDMGKPLAPSKVHFVSAIPKTRNAKVMRRVIRSAYLGEDPGDLSALENPQAVEEIALITQ